MNNNQARGRARRPFVRQMLEQYPTLGTRTLAKMLLEKHPELFSDIEQARACVNDARGTHGSDKRRCYEETWDDFYRIPGTKLDLPQPIVDVDRSPMILDMEDSLLITDIHFPFHVPEVLAIALKYGKKRRTKNILILGDLVDNYIWGFWNKMPLPDVCEKELECTNLFFRTVRTMFGDDANIYWLMGNHEERFDIRIYANTPEIKQYLDECEKEDNAALFERAHGVMRYGIKVIKHRRMIYLGKLTVMHGHEVGKMATPISPARSLFTRFRDIAACGHFHRTSMEPYRTGRDRYISVWSIGCLCDLHPLWRPVGNDWNHGFAFYTRTDSEGNFVLDNKRIINGMIV